MGGKSGQGGGSSGWYINEIGCPGVPPPPSPSPCILIPTVGVILTYAFSPNINLVPGVHITGSLESACNAFTLYEQADTIPTNSPHFYTTFNRVRALEVGEKVYDNNTITNCTPYKQLMTGYFLSNQQPTEGLPAIRQVTHIVNGIIQSITLCS